MKLPVVTKLLSFCLILMAGLATALAQQNGTWTNDASSVWSATTNWLNGVVADGSGATADFTLNNGNLDTVTMDASHTLSTLLFGAAGGNKTNNWILNASGGSVLTLAGGTPTITVSNGVSTNTVLASVPLAGSSGLTKAGSGALVLAGANSYTGATAVNAGTLQLTNSTSTGPLLYMSFDDVNGNVVVNDGSLGAVANGLIVGTNVSIVAGGRYGNALQVGSGPVTSGGVFINHAVTLLNSTNNTTTSAWTVAMWVKTTTATNGGLLYQGGNTWASGNTRFYLAGNTNDFGGPYFGGVRNSQGWEVGQTPINDGNWHFVAMTTAAPGNVKKIYVDGVLDAFSATPNDNLWTNNATGNQVWIGGAPNISDNNVGLNGMIDEVYIYNRALSQAEVGNLMNTSSTPLPQAILPAATAVALATGTKLDLNGGNATVTGLSGGGTVDNTLTNAGAPPTLSTLTINNASDIAYTGIITNSSGIMSVVKNGAGALTLSNLNGYAGMTILNSGTLNINQASAIGTAGTLMITGGTLDNTSGGTVTVVNNRTETWAGDFSFGGTTNLVMGTGAVTLAGPGTNRTITVNTNTLTVGSIGGTTGPGYGLVKAGTGTLQMSGGVNGTISGPLTINGGKIQMTSDFTTTGLYGTGVIETVRGINKWLFVNNPVDETFFGVIQTSPGATARELGLNKGGVGTLTLPSTNTFNDQMTVNQGVLKITGSISNGFGNNGVVQVGYTAGQKAVLSIAGGSVYAGKSGNPSVSIAPGANFIGALNLSAGSLTSVSELHIGNGSGAATTLPYAALTMNGGTLTSGSYLVVGFNNDRAVFNQSGGAAAVTANVMTIGAGGVNAIGVANLSGGTFTSTAASGGIYVGERGIGVLNVSGAASVLLANVGLNIGPIASQSGWDGTANLLGGTVAVNRVAKGVGTGAAKLNFNGGTLKATGANASFLTGLDSAYVYGGGAVIDDGGFAITIGQQLLAPSGQGVVSIPVIAGGSNYIDAPLVLITNIDGSGATASAQIDYALGVVTNILVSNPGNDYSTPPTVALVGGGGSGASLGTPTLAANSAGGLTKLGSGTLTLSAGNGFAGQTKVLGGTLNVNNITFNSPTDLLVTNGTLAIDASSGAPFGAGNVTLQNNAVININYGALSANPNFAALNASGSLLAPGTGLTIAVNGLGLRPGTITLVKYTGTALSSLANISVTLPPGVAATLVNNQGNDSIDLNITTAPQNLTWEGTAGVSWDINSTVNWKDANNNAQVYLQYTNGAVIVGDATRFDDTLTNDFVNPQPTNIVLTTTVQSFPIVVDSTLPYSFGGAGSIAGSGYLVKSNTGTLYVGLSNSYSGGTIVAGGTLIITNDTALGATSGLLTMNGGALQIAASVTNTRALSVTANSILDIPTNLTMQIGGVGTGAGALIQADAGTIVLTGIMSNTPVVDGGTFRIPSGKVAAPGVIHVGNLTSSNGVMIISGGVVQANNASGQFNSSMNVGSAATTAGSLQMSSGTLATAQQFALGAGAGGYGGMNFSGGTATFGSYFVVGFNNDIAVYNQSGGTMTVQTNLLTIAAGGALSAGVATFSGGTFTSINGASGNSGGRGGMFVGENGTGTLNVMGSAALSLIGDANVTMGRTGAGSTGTANLDGGTVTTAQVSKGAGTAILNFNGGTLKASTNNANFMNGLTGATIFNGGAIVNDGGFSITVGQPLAAAGGFGISSIPLSSGGGGYIDDPMVTISGGSGSNATAIAQINYLTGVVTNLVVTCPGSGYANGDSVDVSFTGGGGSGASAGTAVWVANGVGGLTKLGSGALTLSGADTYAGGTVVGAGQLILTPAHQVTGAVTVTNGATLGVLVGNGGTATAGNLNLGTSATGTNFLSFILNAGTNPVVAPLQVGTLTSLGTNYVRLSGVISPGTFPVVQYAGSLAGSGLFATNVLGPQGMVATLSNNVASSTLYVTVTAAPGLVWTGTNTVAGLANLWNIGVTNWLAAGVPAAYTEPTAPGDSVFFNDAGLGTVIDSNTLSPANVVISNNAVTYTFQGPGHIAGTTGITKLGSGTATVNLAGDTYTGNTVINGGVLQLGSATVIPVGTSAGNVSVGSAGTLDLNGVSPSINGLSGSGIINNSSAAASVLTMGSNNAAINWSGMITNTGTAGSSLIKVGTNSMVITGTNFLASAAQSQINGGSLLLTNGGALYMTGGAEFWVQQNAGTASAVVDGGTLVVSNNWLVIARNNVNAIGTLTLNNGLIQKAGANNVVVGSLGANGVLTVNGGQLLNNGNLWLGEGAGANATLNLNGGLVQASQVRTNAAAPASSIANFNGGTLQATAGSTNFFMGTTINIMAGGLIFDDNGFAITNATQVWADGGGGGVIKKGTGTLWLDTGNTYSGTTLVTNGTLAGSGSIAGPLVVAPAGNLGAGDAGGVGIFTVNNNATLQGNATLRVSKTGGTPAQDNVTVTGNIGYGGTLTVNNVTSDSTPLTTSDTFQLFSVSGTPSGNFISIVGTPGPGLAYSFNPASGVLSIVTGVASNPTNITASVSGTTLTLSWPADHIGWILQAQTNALSTGLSPAGTWFDVPGSDASNTNVMNINPAKPTVFYRLRHP